MRVTEMTKPMLLLTEEEKQRANAYFSQGLECYKQGDYEGAAQRYTMAAKMGHPVAQNNLAVLYASGKGVARNGAVASQLYLDAARHGSIAAQANIGERYLSGRNITQDTDTGLAWLNAAASESARACRILAEHYGKAGDEAQELAWRRNASELGDKDSREWLEKRSGSAESFIGPSEVGFRRNLSKPMPISEGRTMLWYSQRREYYLDRYINPPTVAFYEQKLYYIAGCDDVCVSELAGWNEKVLFQAINASECALTVNCLGIFVYAVIFINNCDVLWIREFDLDGRKVQEHTVEAAGCDVSSVYNVDAYFYYTSKQNGKTRLCVYDVTNRTAEVLYSRADHIYSICALIHCVIFKAGYDHPKGCLEEKGWMLYDRNTGQVRCLDCTLSPEYALDHPEYFDWNSLSYVEDVTRWKFVFFDMERSIVWVERPALDAEDKGFYWEAHEFLKPGLPLVPDLPIWRINRERLEELNSGRMYFDGDRLFLAPNPNSFYSCDRMGQIYKWQLNNDGHGHCDQFLVFEDYLFLDSDSRGEMLYEASADPSHPDPLRESWLHESPGLPGGASAIGVCLQKTLTASDIKYGILTFGSKLDLDSGAPITVVFGEQRYSAKVSRSNKGRVDGVKRLFTDFGLEEGDALQVNYVEADGAIYLERV